MISKYLSRATALLAAAAITLTLFGTVASFADGDRELLLAARSAATLAAADSTTSAR
jgi:hypothetical protein